MKRSELRQLIKEELSFFKKKPKEELFRDNKYARKSTTPGDVPEVYSKEFKNDLENIVYKHISKMTYLDPEDTAWLVDIMLKALIEDRKQ